MKVSYLVVAEKDGLTPAQRFPSIVKQDGTFYIVGEDLYFVDKKITNAADLADLEADLDDILETLEKLENTEETSGSIRNIVKSYLTAAQISIEDDGGFFESDNVEGALAELAAASAEGVDSKKIWMTDNSAGQSDYAKVYKIWQGENDPNDPIAEPPATLIGTINIPDLFVQSGSVVDVVFLAADGTLHEGTGAGPDVTNYIVGPLVIPTEANAGKYIKLVLQNVDDPLFIAVKDLVDLYTGGTTAEATILISQSNEITVEIGKIAASKIVYKAADDTDPEHPIAEKTVEQALDELYEGGGGGSGADLSDLDADLDATGIPQHEGTFVVSGVTQVDGLLTGVDSVEVENAGAAAAVLGDSNDDAYAKTVYGAFAAVQKVAVYVGTLPPEATATDVVGYIQEVVGDDIDDVTGSAVIASVASNVVTLKAGVTQDAAAISNSSDPDITLEEVAMTGAAEDVSIADVNGLFTATNVEEALAELAGAFEWNEV